MIEEFLQKLDIPESCTLDKRVFKKLFEENGHLDVTDKKALKDDVQDVRWLYTLKPTTINIPRYADDQRDYPEIAVLLVTLTHPTRFTRIADFIQQAIPYPLVLLFAHEERIALCLADKRINQADREKWVIEERFDTGWIDLCSPTEVQRQFLGDLSISRLSFLHFYALYQDLCARVVALNCANHNGRYEVKAADDSNGQHRVQLLRDIQKLAQRQAELRNQLKKETQMGKQVALNTEIHQIGVQMEQFKHAL